MQNFTIHLNLGNLFRLIFQAPIVKDKNFKISVFYTSLKHREFLYNSIRLLVLILNILLCSISFVKGEISVQLAVANIH